MSSLVAKLAARDAPLDDEAKKRYRETQTNLYKRKETLLNKVNELYLQASTLAKTKVQFSLHMFGRYYIFNSEDNVGGWFPSIEEIETDYPKPRLYTPENWVSRAERRKRKDNQQNTAQDVPTQAQQLTNTNVHTTKPKAVRSLILADEDEDDMDWEDAGLDDMDFDDTDSDASGDSSDSNDSNTIGLDSHKESSNIPPHSSFLAASTLNFAHDMRSFAVSSLPPPPPPPPPPMACPQTPPLPQQAHHYPLTPSQSPHRLQNHPGPGFVRSSLRYVPRGHGQILGRAAHVQKGRVRKSSISQGARTRAVRSVDMTKHV